MANIWIHHHAQIRGKGSHPWCAPDQHHGPTSIITFMNDLPLHVVSPLDVYADDSAFSVIGETIADLEIKLNADLTNVQQWCQITKMAANSDKTKVMLVTTYQKEAKISCSVINFNFNDTLLDNVIAEKLLGVVIDKHLCWKDHINQIAKTISKSMALLRRFRKYLPYKTRITFYESFIQPHIDYCNTIWGQSSHVSCIHNLQKMALRLIMNVPKLTHSAPLFRECEIMHIKNVRTVTIVYKTVNGLTPQTCYTYSNFRLMSQLES